MLLDRKNLKKHETTMGTKKVSVISAPRPLRGRAFVNILLGLKSLLAGMRVTFSYFSRPSTVVTQQYPENRQTLKMKERYRAQLRLKHNDKGYHQCTGCKICDVACPNASIFVTDRRGVSGKMEVDQFIWRMDTCTFCNLCVIVCPHDALEMTPNFESSVFDRRLLSINLNQYAGPPKKYMDKLEDDKDPKSMMEPREVFIKGTLLRDAADDEPLKGEL